MRCVYEHGHDATLGTKPLGQIVALQEDAIGATYEVALLDTDYVRSLIPALSAGLLGSSFRFHIPRDGVRVDYRPERSEYNPAGLPEHTVTQARVVDFGPCTFPVYQGTTAGVRASR